MSEADIRLAFESLLGRPAETVLKMPGGSSLPTWQLRADEERFAARLYGPGRSAEAYGQAALLAYLHTQNYPAPEVVACNAWKSGVFSLLRWLPGEPLSDVLRQRPDEAQVWGRRFGSLHARLHQLPVPDAARAAMPMLPSLTAAEARLLHGDYHPGNVLADEELSGVIDWENICLGEPGYDVARTLSILCIDPGLRAAPRRVRRIVRTFRQGYLEGYREVAPGSSYLPGHLVWAGEFMLSDLAHRYDATALEPVRRWTMRWRGRLKRS